MKRFIFYFILFILFIFSFFAVLPAKADIIPLSSRNIKHYGIGVLNMPQSYKVYQYPYEDAKIIREACYDNLKNSAIVNSVDMRKVSYVAYVPSNNVALLTVDLNPGNNWYCVFLNQETGETGWVYNDNPDAFYTYRRLFYDFGKKYGLRLFGDLTNEEKVLYAKEDTNSQVIERLTYPKFITFTVIRGNWMLVSVNDMTKQAKVGWFNWRNDDGTLNIFPNLKEQN